ncbi:uncharacterized protein LOC128200689 [Galleria mellonella]|nr:uncharacterized protein LOC128200689 [Galleria mellonella]
MRGPYKVTRILPSGRYELKLLSGSYGKTTQAAAEYMVQWHGEWCPETCASFFANNSDDSDPIAGPSGSQGSTCTPQNVLEEDLCLSSSTDEDARVEDDSTSG